MKRIFLSGASSGIGLATAQLLIARGDLVWGTSRNPATLPRHENLHPVQLDLRSIDNIETAFAQSVAEAGHFDVVINNAGSGHFGPAELLSMADLSDQFQIVFFGHVRLMQLALADMRRTGRGTIINITSLAALLPVPFMAAYNAAKSAMASFTMSTQLEMGAGDIRIIDIQPGDIRTNFNDVVSKGPPSQYDEDVAKTWRTVDRNMKAAPGPEVVAQKIVKVIDERHPPGQVCVGDVFQTKIAPFIFRFLPQRTRIWGLKKYYGI